jgi:hypothetical protein
LQITYLGKGLYVFSGDGGDVTAIVDDGTTLLIDSGLASRITELSGAIFKTTMRPVTRLVNTSVPQVSSSLLRKTLSISSRPYKTCSSLNCATVTIHHRRCQE